MANFHVPCGLNDKDHGWSLVINIIILSKQFFLIYRWLRKENYAASYISVARPAYALVPMCNSNSSSKYNSIKKLLSVVLDCVPYIHLTPPLPNTQMEIFERTTHYYHYPCLTLIQYLPVLKLCSYQYCSY